MVALTKLVGVERVEKGRFWIYSEGKNNRISCQTIDGI